MIETPVRLEEAVGQKLLWSFEGTTPSPEIMERIAAGKVSGVTLFTHLNVEGPAQLRDLTAALQAAAGAAPRPPLLIGADQEGGQLMAVGGGATPFPGNLALGATGSATLAREAGFAIGRELAAMGINLNYAPVCDANTNPQNPVIGTRSFGEDPMLVGRLATAMVEGLQAAGVAATAKHFPGHGDTADDSHHGTPVLLHDEERLRAVEWLPFRAAVEAGVRAVMVGHVALPHLTAGSRLPATLCPTLLRRVLRDEFGFTGVVVSDAMSMAAITRGGSLSPETLAATVPGLDLLLMDGPLSVQDQLYADLLHAARRGLAANEDLPAAVQRIRRLKQWTAAQPTPALDVVGCTEHQALARQIARESITLVRDQADTLPLRLSPGARVAVITPRPVDLTPADTSSAVTCLLADAVRRRHPHVDEYSVAHHPTEAEIRGLRTRLADYDLAIVGTLNAFAQAEQALMVNELLATGVAVIGVAMRMPYDLCAFPSLPTCLCSYSLLEPSMEAVAEVLWGECSRRGRLPVSIPGLYPLGHGL